VLHAIALTAVLAAPPAGSGATGFLDRTLTHDGAARRYQVYVPRDYTPAKRWPVILFLHGGGETGTDGLLQTEGGLGSAIRRHPERWPAIVVFPQLRPERRWSGREADAALAALAATQREFATDSARVYLTGLSRGGAGSWYLAYRHSGRFAALLVSCGRVTRWDTLGGRPSPDRDPVVPAPDRAPFAALAARLGQTPVWIFHGDADPIISVEESRKLAAALRERAAPYRYTELAGVGHGAWEQAYASPDVPQWLFAQRRKHVP